MQRARDIGGVPAAAVETSSPGVPAVCCIVLSFNRGNDLRECLASLDRGTYGNQKLLVLDCGEQGAFTGEVRDAFPGVSVIQVRDNRGYAGNNNAGMTAALAQGAEWLFLLNDDAVAAPDCLSKLIEAGTASPRIGIVGPMVYHHQEPEVIQSAGGGLTRFWEGFHHGQDEVERGQFQGARDVDWVSGCAILVRREMVLDVGPLDERFFMYWEETEWCVRARQAGWRVVHVPAARVWHKGVQREHRPKPAVTYYATRNRLLMLRVRRAPLAARVVAWAQMLRTLASWTVRPKWSNRRDHRDALWQGLTDFLHRRWGPMNGAGR